MTGVEHIEDTRPLALHAEVELEPNESSEPNTIALVNPHDEPWEVHEVKFSVRPKIVIGTGDLLQIAQASGALLSCALDAGGEPMTNGLVPVWSFGPSYEPDMEYVQAFNWGRPAVLSQLLPWWEVWVESYYRWRFDHPLYLKPGQSVVPAFKHTGLTNQAIVAGITVSGRRLLNAPTPRTIKIPYAAAWQSKFYDAVTTADAEEESPETALRNRFDTPLTVERFIGRINQRAQTQEDQGGTGAADRFQAIAEAFEGPWANSLFKVRQFDSKGNAIVRERAGFRSVYGWRTRAWHCQHALPAGAYHKVLLTKKTVSGLSLYASANPNKVVSLQAAAQVSMIGWREVKP